ncbi:MAG: UMP kinase [Christensenellaceae bacterium]|jgi:UMP kinase|nr:UMP kinase [Christensenellaceae bacterium]MBS6563962.1 UMP kinase [Clostridiales bacterium]PWL95999.1 MAG: UMP kinase [Selenomonadales bacterium]
MQPAYKRVVIKISGEALAGENGFGISGETISKVAEQIISVVKLGVEVGIVIGAGNIWRGRQGRDMDRSTADHMGMLATVINSLAMQDALEHKGYKTRVMTAIAMNEIAEPYIRRKAMSHLDKKLIVIFACGTGNPFFSTDTTAALRAAEIEADVVLMAKNIDGVYEADPRKNPSARRYKSIRYMDVLEKGIQVMDSTATSLCMDNDIPLKLFALKGEESILKAVCGQGSGTTVSNGVETEFY